MNRIAIAIVAALAASPALSGSVSYQAEGKNLTGYFAAAQSPKGLVLIVHDWDGLNDYERRRGRHAGRSGL